MGFVLARFQYLSIDGIFCGNVSGGGAAPGKCYFYQGGFRRTGIILHLATCLPAFFLVCFQFVPAIRYKLLIFHRFNGYVVIILMLLSNAGVLMIARYAFQGSLETQTVVGVMVIYTTIGLAMAYYNIKRLQIEQHRAWMLRTFFVVRASSFSFGHPED
jgi:uncharacterized membrane protein